MAFRWHWSLPPEQVWYLVGPRLDEKNKHQEECFFFQCHPFPNERQVAVQPSPLIPIRCIRCVLKRDMSDLKEGDVGFRCRRTLGNLQDTLVQPGIRLTTSCQSKNICHASHMFPVFKPMPKNNFWAFLSQYNNNIYFSMEVLSRNSSQHNSTPSPSHIQIWPRNHFTANFEAHWHKLFRWEAGHGAEQIIYDKKFVLVTCVSFFFEMTFWWWSQKWPKLPSPTFSSRQSDIFCELPQTQCKNLPNAPNFKP